MERCLESDSVFEFHKAIQISASLEQLFTPDLPYEIYLLKTQIFHYHNSK